LQVVNQLRVVHGHDGLFAMLAGRYGREVAVLRQRGANGLRADRPFEVAPLLDMVNLVPRRITNCERLHKTARFDGRRIRLHARRSQSHGIVAKGLDHAPTVGGVRGFAESALEDQAHRTPRVVAGQCVVLAQPVVDQQRAGRRIAHGLRVVRAVDHPRAVLLVKADAPPIDLRGLRVRHQLRRVRIDFEIQRLGADARAVLARCLIQRPAGARAALVPACGDEVEKARLDLGKVQHQREGIHPPRCVLRHQHHRPVALRHGIAQQRRNPVRVRGKVRKRVAEDFLRLLDTVLRDHEAVAVNRANSNHACSKP
jgi:hypothetical protein